MEPLPVAQIRALLAQAPEADLPKLLRRFGRDTRPGVVSAVDSARRRSQAHDVEHARLSSLAELEWRLADDGLRLVAGVDEVGRGALAGPVTAGACILPRNAMLVGLDDSKRLTAGQRERLYGQIAGMAVAVSVAHAQPAEIDALGIGAATVLAMRRALAGLGLEVQHVLVDGRPVDVGVASTAIVKGDSRVRAIAAAAIVAKVTRDALMRELDVTYPGYGLAGNKGYGSADHLRAITEIGPSAIHRMSFTPCSQSTLF